MVMKTITIEKNIYDFNELSETAKENARRLYLEFFHENYMFSDMLKEDIAYTFEKSDMNAEYSLSSCQGDGLNVYGNLDIRDAVKIYEIRAKAENLEITKKEYRFLEWLKKQTDIIIKLDANGRYTYFTDKTEDIIYYITFDMENNYYRGIPYDFIEKFAKVVNEYLEIYCKKWEETGYEFFYSTEGIDEEIVEIFEANGYRGFEENGEPVY